MRIQIALQKLLDEKNLSQHQLAKMTDIPQPAINLICQNKAVRFPLDRLAIICGVLECDVSDILILEKEQTE